MLSPRAPFSHNSWGSSVVDHFLCFDFHRMNGACRPYTFFQEGQCFVSKFTYYYSLRADVLFAVRSFVRCVSGRALCFSVCFFCDTPPPVVFAYRSTIDKFTLRHVRKMQQDRDVSVRWMPEQPSSLLVFETGPDGGVDASTVEVRAGTDTAAQQKVLQLSKMGPHRL